MRCKKKSWRSSKCWRQTSMTQGYRSWFQDLINVWTMLLTILKNKVMYRQFIHSVTFVNYKCCTCLRPLCLYFPDTPLILVISDFAVLQPIVWLQYWLSFAVPQLGWGTYCNGFWRSRLWECGLGLTVWEQVVSLAGFFVLGGNLELPWEERNLLTFNRWIGQQCPIRYTFHIVQTGKRSVVGISPVLHLQQTSAI